MSEIIRVDPIVNTDGQIWIGPQEGEPRTGTWSNSFIGNIVTRRHVAIGPGSTADYYLPIGLPTRGTDGRGRQLTSAKVIYSVDVENAAGVGLGFERWVVPADGVVMANHTPLAGVWDTNHNNAAKRGVASGAPTYHTGTFTFTTPVFVEQGVGYQARFDMTAGPLGNTVVNLFGLMIYYTEILVP
jgi:hypothetical protein